MFWNNEKISAYLSLEVSSDTPLLKIDVGLETIEELYEHPFDARRLNHQRFCNYEFCLLKTEDSLQNGHYEFPIEFDIPEEIQGTVMHFNFNRRT